jgi:ribokinase
VNGRVVVLGSLNLDLVTTVDAHPTPGETVRGTGLARLPGGKGANQALAAARAGAQTRLIGRVGADEAGSAYRSGLSERGVDCTGIEAVDGEPTGHALIAVDARGENTIIVIPGANGALDESQLADPATVEAITGADVLLLQLEIPLPTVRRAASLARDAGVRVLLNPSPWADLPADLLAAADPVIVNEHEAALLPPGQAGSVCVTLGADGARWGDHHVAAARIDVVDTTGAGDAFAGTLAAALATGAGEREALAAATAAATEACGWPGAQNWTL